VRARGYQPSMKDDEHAWVRERARVSASPRTVALLGASRIQLGFSPPAFRAALPRWTYVQLAIDGTQPAGSLRDLAADPRGLALAAPPAERLDALRRLSQVRQQADVALRARYAPRVLEAPTRDQAELLRALGYTDGGEDDDETEDPGGPPGRDRQDPGPDDDR